MNNPTHSGRNAFRRVSGRDLVKDLEAMDMDEIRRQQFAMRSFTDSVEVDDLPLPPVASHLERRLTATSEEGACWPDNGGDWPGELGIGQGMHSSSTNNTIDTIIEMKLPRGEESVDQQLGETQKYVMSVPGPGHVDQEMELHKSLLTESAETPGTTSSDEMESLAAVQALMDTAGQWDTNSPRQCRSPSNQNDLLDQNAIRQEFNRVATQRPRPTTPTSWSALESYVIERDSSNKSRDVESAFVPISERMPPDCGAKIKVALPGQRDGSPHSGSFRGRQSSMSWSDFYETMAGQQQVQCAELNEQSKDQDLLETNPAYAYKAPPKPVVNRRSSVEWENFEEARQLQQETTDNNKYCYEEDTRPWDGNNDQLDCQQQTASPPADWESNPADFVVDALSENHLSEDQPCSSDMYSGDGTGNDTSSASNPFAVPQQENPFVDPSSAPAIAPTRVAPPPPPGQPPAAYYQPPASDPYAWGDTSTTSTTADLSNPYYSNTQYSNIYSGYDQDAPSTQDHSQPYDQDQLNQVVPTVDDYSYASNPYSQPDAYNQYGGEAAYDPYAQYGAQPAGYEATDTYPSQPEANQYNDVDYTAPYEGYSDAYVGYEQNTQVDITGYEQAIPGYEQAPQVDITGTDAYGTSFEYNQEYRAGTEPSVAAVATTFLSQPILPPQRSRTPDPFSWEVQETAYEQHGSAVAPPPRPAPPITPSRSPEPGFGGSDNLTAGALSPSGEEQMSSVIGSSKSPPPPRPGAPPPRPAAPSPSPVRPPPPSLSGSPFGDRRVAEQAAAQKKQEEEEEDPWAKFKQMTEQVSSVVNKTTQQLSKLSENSAADDIVDESYVAQVGGNQGFQLNSAQKQILQMQEDQKKQKADKKKRGKRPLHPPMTQIGIRT
uniref:Uncharacterized protein n=1 Tax=Ditylenchus dipsaci TaxID=166011 RepID=A0A915E1D0_9BILA